MRDVNFVYRILGDGGKDVNVFNSLFRSYSLICWQH